MTTPTSGPIDLDGQTAVVTGAAGGQGRAICEALAREGADVVASDVDEDGLGDIAETVTDHDRTCHTVRCDVSDPDDVAELSSVAIDDHDSVEILVTAHGVITRKDLSDMSLDEWQRDVAVNLTGNFLVAHEFYDHMKDNGYGKVVAIGSIAGITGGLVAGPNYSAAKAGVHAFVKWIAQNGGEHGVVANAIAPGPIRTPFAEDVELESSPPVPRWGEPEDIAEPVLFLASQQSNYVTGQVLVVDGGILL